MGKLIIIISLPIIEQEYRNLNIDPEENSKNTFNKDWV
jgi:hypothetical protein